MTSSTQFGPFPAAPESVDDLLAVDGLSLPESATVVRVTESQTFPVQGGDWAYTIEIAAPAESLRAYYTRVTGFDASVLDDGVAATPAQIERFEIASHPPEDAAWETVGAVEPRNGDTQLLFERPLGRAWFLVRAWSR